MPFYFFQTMNLEYKYNAVNAPSVSLTIYGIIACIGNLFAMTIIIGISGLKNVAEDIQLPNKIAIAIAILTFIGLSV